MSSSNQSAGDFAGRRIVDVPPRSAHVAPEPTAQHWTIANGEQAADPACKICGIHGGGHTASCDETYAVNPTRYYSDI